MTWRQAKVNPKTRKGAFRQTLIRALQQKGIRLFQRRRYDATVSEENEASLTSADFRH
jgi:hypothetical protein